MELSTDMQETTTLQRTNESQQIEPVVTDFSAEKQEPNESEEFKTVSSRLSNPTPDGDQSMPHSGDKSASNTSKDQEEASGATKYQLPVQPSAQTGSKHDLQNMLREEVSGATKDQLAVQPSAQTGSKHDLQNMLREEASGATKDQLPVQPSAQTGSVDDLQNMLRDAPHLKEEFERIDSFERDLEMDPTIDCFYYENFLEFKHLTFEDEPDADRKMLGDYMAMKYLADLINASYEAVLSGLGIDCMASLPADMMKTKQQTVLKCTLLGMIVGNNTDVSPAFCEKVCKSGMLKHFVKDLEVIKVEDCVVDNEELQDVLQTAMTILQNCSRNPATRQTLREYNTVKHLLPFLKGTPEEVKLNAVFTLAHLVDEPENELLLVDDSVYDSLTAVLTKAWADGEHRHLEFSVEEMVDGMTGLAKNQTNKRVLVEKGAVPILTDILKDGSDEEKEHAVKCIWELALDHENKHTFKEDVNLNTQLRQLKLCGVETVGETAGRILWVIEVDDKDDRVIYPQNL